MDPYLEQGGIGAQLMPPCCVPAFDDQEEKESTDGTDRSDPQGPLCPNTILAAGMSRALNTALNSAESELLLLVLILDRDSGRILDAECNIILGINSDYIASLLVGRNFYQELDEIILSIQQQYFGPGQRALIVCLKDAYSKMRARSPRSLPLRK